jgi:hypothetical protein
LVSIVINNANNKLGLGVGSLRPTNGTPSRVTRRGIRAHDDRHISWDWYIWIVVCLIFYQHVIRWNINLLMLISKYILLDHVYAFDTQSNFMNCKTWRNNCLIIYRWQILVNNQRGNHNPYIEEELTIHWPKVKVQKDKQRSTKHTHSTKDRVTRTPL